MKTVVIVGGGVGSAAAAAGLRNEGFGGEVIIVSAESHLPYERPPLSKEFLAGQFVHSQFQVNPEQWYVDNAVELALGVRATDLDVGAAALTLDDGRRVAYDALVLATGVRARSLPGFAGSRVHSLRTVEDAERLARKLTPGTHLGILGAGFIGCEVAAIAAGMGVRVSVFDPSPRPLARVLGAHLAEAVLGLHDAQGVSVRPGCTVTSMSENDSGVRLLTDAGESIECDELLVGVGSVPNSELAVHAGLEVEGGIVTDEYGRTQAPGVYAIGDVARRRRADTGTYERVEHHDTAVRHGANVARNILGASEPYTDQHYFWSHQYDHTVQSVGHFDPSARIVVRGDVRDGAFSVFSLAGDRITGMVALNRPADVLPVRKVLATSHSVTDEQLADESFVLKGLLPQKSRTRVRTEVAR